MSDLLPEDVLTNIISRLAPRYLAVCRCVSKTWCAIIDAHNLLRADLLPRSVCGIFINFNELCAAEFFSRPSKGPTVSGNFDYMPCRSRISDHCNGLLLLYKYVVNPATRQWAPLPPYPSLSMPEEHFSDREYLVFDPTLSPHYEVFLIPMVRSSATLRSDREVGPAIEELEWPPSPCILHVFSSRTKEWEERLFVREGEAVGNVAEMQSAWPYVQDNAVYWRGVLYVNCQTKFVMRLSLSDGKYQVIKPPVIDEVMGYAALYLGQSEKGVYCALSNQCTVRIYILDESTGKMDWIFKHSCNVWSISQQRIDGPGPWTLQDINYQNSRDEYEDGNNEAIVEEKYEWDSDNDNVIDTKTRGKCRSDCYIDFLGFHPYKEIVFLSDTMRRGLAYHLNSSKIQDLGNLHPTHYGTGIGIQPFIEKSFPYTAWMGEFPKGN